MFFPFFIFVKNKKYTHMRSFHLKAVFIFFLSISMLSCAQEKKGNSDDQPTATQKNVISLISPAELNKANDNIQLIDIRTPQEFAEGHIENAKNINYYDVDFFKEMNKLDKSKPIYIYCRSGGRSGKAASRMRTQGFKKIYDLQGGIINWNKNNLKVVK